MAPYGGDICKLPAYIVDALVILVEEHARVESLRYTKKPQQQKRQR